MKKHTFPRPLSVLGTLIIVLVMALSTSPTGAQPPTSDGLFSSPDAPADTATDETGVLRSRCVTVNMSQLGERVTLNLFDDAVYTGIQDHTESTPITGYTWIGHLEDVALSQVILVVYEDFLVGQIVSPESVYEIRYTGNSQFIVQIDQSAFPEELRPIPVDIPADEGSLQTGAAGDDGSLIDVLVVYSSAARAADGGTSAMEARIDLAIAETNQSYANSGIAQRVNLVYAAEVSDAADHFSTDLSRLQNGSDGYMDQVHTWRDAYRADEIVLIIENDASCGLANVMNTVHPAMEAYAFVVVHRTCATGYYSFGHELGHNMGARHDWYTDDVIFKPYQYNKGYVNVAERWRTVMAYDNLCLATPPGTSCTRLPYWSNPDVTFGGDPMGVISTGPFNCQAGSTTPDPSTCVADNRLTLNNTAYTVANFRDSSDRNTWQGIDNDWHDASNWSLLTVPTTTQAVVIPSSPAGGHFPHIDAAAFAEYLTIESGAGISVTSSGSLSVENAVIDDDGSLGQTKTVAGDTVFEFLHIKNDAGDATCYYGVDVNPGPSLPLGDTTVTVRDREAGSSCVADNVTLARCFRIDAQNDTGRDATVRLYFQDDDLNGQNCANLDIYHDGGTSWSTLNATVTCNPGGVSYIEATGVGDFSTLVVAETQPTTFKLVYLPLALVSAE